MALLPLGSAGQSSAQDTGAGPTAILCIGDSLTRGAGDINTSWPMQLEELTGLKVYNRGLRGWTPRHLTYAFLLRDCDNLTVEDLLVIPPEEMENRRFQPDINNRRTMMADGQMVIVREGEKGLPVVYAWDDTSTASPDGLSVVKPDVVGQADHVPPVPEGRWLRQDKPASWQRTGEMTDLCIAWVGANGMDCDEMAAALSEIEKRYCLGPDKRFFVIGLVNRQYYTASPQAIANWGRLIDACNDSIRTAYPDNHLDLQAWMTRTGPWSESGGFRTLDWFPDATPVQVADDEADIAAGIVPRSLRAPDNVTHFSADGDRVICAVIYETLQQKRLLP
jgi:hypothetical protein